MKQYLYNDKSDRELLFMLNKQYEVFSKPTCKTILNGYILPRKENNKNWGDGGVLTESLDYVEMPEDQDFGGKYDFELSSVDEYDCEVVYLGYLIPHYGVFLVDFFRRIYYFLQQRDNGNHLKLAFCGVNFCKGEIGQINSNCESLLKMLDIEKDDYIDVRNVSKFRKIIIPDVGYDYDKWFYNDYITPFRMICRRVEANKQFPDISFSKIYLSRRKFASNKEAGEWALECFFRDNGFSVLYPEELNLETQIYLFSKANYIASIEGTVAHNILFSKPGTNQIIIRKQKWINPRQVIFNQLTDTNVQYIDCYKELFKKYPTNFDVGPFLLIFNENIMAFAEDNGFKVCPIKMKLCNLLAYSHYLWICFKRTVKAFLDKN